MQASPYIIVLILTALLAVGLAVYAWRRRSVPGARALAWLALSIGIWAFFYALELGVAGLATKLLAARLQFIGIVSTPLAWLIFARQYAGDQGWPARRSLLLLLIIPLLTLALVWTNQLHGLIWSSVAAAPAGSFAALEVTHGLWFWVYLAYSYLLMALGSAGLVRAIRCSPELYRWQIGALLLCALAPWAGNMLYLLPTNPLYPLDLTPFGFALSVMALGWALFGFRLLDVVPVAYKTIFQSMHDSVIVLDAHNRVIDLNPSAQQIVGRNPASASLQPINQLFADQPELVARCQGRDEARIAITIGQLERRVYDAQVTPLFDRRGQLSGRLIILHEITDRKRAEDTKQFLAHAGALLSSSLDYQTTLETVARLAVPELADWCMIHLLDAAQSVRRIALIVADSSKQNLVDELQRNYPLDPNAPHSYPLVLRTGQSELVAEVTDTGLSCVARDARHLELLRALGLRSTLSVPLIARERTIGTIMLGTAESDRRYGEADLALAEELARRVALAVDNARLFADLRASEQRYRTLVAQAADSILLTDPDGGILDANERATTLLGYTRAELLNMCLGDLLSPKDSGSIQGMRDALNERGQTFVVECKDRSFCPIGISVGSFAEGERQIFIVIMRDITERKTSKQQIHRQNEELVALHETTLGLINRLEVDRVLESLVARAGALLDTPHGYLYVVDPDPEELVVRIATGIFISQIGYRLRRGEGLAGRVWESGQTLSTDNYLMWSGRQQDIDSLRLRALVSVPIRAGAEFVGVLGLAYLEEMRTFGEAEIALLQRFADMASLALENARLYSAAQQELAERRRTEAALLSAEADLRAAKEQAEAATHAKSEFLAQMSHDMRTLLSSAIGMTTLLEQTALDADQREMVQIIHTSGDSLLALLNNFLDISRIEAGKLILDNHPFNLRACVEETIDLVTGKVADHSLDLAYMLDPDMPAILIGDQPRLQQILVNLLSNATKFTNAGGVFISVSARLLSDECYELHFSIADTGTGIPSAQIEKVFDSFQQLENPSMYQSMGTGLGLAIAKLLSEAMGGRMWVESVVGSGSNFHFTIMVGALAETIRDQMVALTNLAGKHILIVDRHAQSRRALLMYAQSAGMRVSATDSALEALAWAGAGARFDVAVADIHDAFGDQISLPLQLRQQSDMPELPVILLAPLGQQDNRTPTDEHDLLQHKPLKLSLLQTSLLRLFAGRQQSGHTEPTDQRPASHNLVTTPPRILLAEDDRANQQLALRFLEILDCPHAAVSTGAQALAALEREYFDIVLLDIQMPDLDGIAAAQLIREHNVGNRQPYLIAITASTLPEVREKCLSMGMNDYLTKPLQIPELQAALARYYEHVSTRITPAEHLHSRAVGTSADDRVSVPSASGSLDAETLARIRALFGPDQEGELRVLIENYKQDTAALLEKMYVANGAHDMAVLRQAAHQLRSSSAIVAALPLANLCGEFEHAMSTSHTDDWRTWLERIEAEFTRVKAALERELRN